MLNYGLKFHPILKQKLWGGDKLRTHLSKTSARAKTGESWEISGLDTDVSVVSNGEYIGTTLNDLIKEFKEELIGNKVFENFGIKFPLLIKFIDAHQDLSIQLHPDDKLAEERHNSFGKTEMWYVVDADPSSQLIVGFEKNVNKQEYINFLGKGELEKLVCHKKVVPGDSYFIKAGLVHAIGKGVLIAEIQQTSDITYRVYDWERKDVNGNCRELHTDLALDAIDFELNDSFKGNYNMDDLGSSEIVSCQYFTTVFLYVNDDLLRPIPSKDTFIVYMCVEGSGYISCDNNKTNITKGETVLIPAIIDEVVIVGKRMKLLEVYV